MLTRACWRWDISSPADKSRLISDAWRALITSTLLTWSPYVKSPKCGAESTLPQSIIERRGNCDLCAMLVAMLFGYILPRTHFQIKYTFESHVLRKWLWVNQMSPGLYKCFRWFFIHKQRQQNTKLPKIITLALANTVYIRIN